MKGLTELEARVLRDLLRPGPVERMTADDVKAFPGLIRAGRAAGHVDGTVGITKQGKDALVIHDAIVAWIGAAS